jgi:hypothetical protein
MISAAMEPPAGERKGSTRGRGFLTRFGAASFVFFLVKGLFWLALAVAAYVSRGPASPAP